MPGFIDRAIANYRAMSPKKQLEVKAALNGLALIGLLILYELFAEGWRRALGAFLAIALFCIVAGIAGWVGIKIDKLLGPTTGPVISYAVSAVIIVGFIGFVLYIIVSNWGR